MPHSTSSTASTINSPILDQILINVLSTHSLPLSRPWLQKNLPTSALTSTATATTSSSPPLPSLLKTALFRLLSSDITESLAPTDSASQCFPSTAITSPTTSSVTLSAAASKISVQVLDIIDIGSSLSAQLEALEAAARGESRRGREIVRSVDVEGAGHGTAGSSNGGGGSSSVRQTSNTVGPFKILLQDANGVKAWAFTKQPIEGINMPLVSQQSEPPSSTTTTMSIGCKLLLLGLDVKRGLVMLDPSSTKVLGGKVDEWDRAWKLGRVERLRGELVEMAAVAVAGGGE